MIEGTMKMKQQFHCTGNLPLFVHCSDCCDGISSVSVFLFPLMKCGEEAFSSDSPTIPSVFLLGQKLPDCQLWWTEDMMRVKICSSWKKKNR